nr:TetR/AcrR family transcriptional regulator [Kineosphaera limosa]
MEVAILDAAWAQLAQEGYANFTFASVAARAGTSRPVLYRRWATKEELVLAAVEHGGRQVRRTIPDTGLLRGDVIQVLLDLNETRADFSAMLVARLGVLYSQTDVTPADLRDRFLRGNTVHPLRTVVARAVERGEVDPQRVRARVLAVPIDLVRHGLMMRLAPLPRSEIEEIVDDVFLPLLGVPEPEPEPAFARPAGSPSCR